MSEGIDYQAELARLNARRTELRNEYIEAIRQQDMVKGQPSVPEQAPTARAIPQIDADLALVDRQIDDAARALLPRMLERGEAMAPELVEPAYLRNNVALTLVEQQAARAAKEGQV